MKCPLAPGEVSHRARWASRIAITCGTLFALFFATNIVREHYPAFALVDQGNFQVDRYQGFHPDIFQHRDGHYYINNNVATSAVAAVPLVLFDPILDRLEAIGRAEVADAPQATDPEYRTQYSLRQKMFALVKEQGLHLRFGGAAGVTAVFLMAPLSVLCVLAFYRLLVARQVPAPRAAWLAVVFGLGTPIWFRSAHLSNNMFVMYGTFAAFWLLCEDLVKGPRPGGWRRFAAGCAAGFALAADYSGLIPLGCLYGFLVLRRRTTAGWKVAVWESLPFIAGSALPIGFLLFSQWAMFGNALVPAQKWMPAANFTELGWRGFAFPSPDLFLLNLLHPSYGLWAFSPLLLLGLLPPPRAGRRLLSPAERVFCLAFTGLFLLFCAANQYARMQWNTGVRYLLPLVPFLFLIACERLSRMPRAWLLVLTVPAVLHMWVLCMARDCLPPTDTWRDAASLGEWLQGLSRETVPASYLRILREGPQLPWLTVLRRTSPAGQAVVHSPWVVPLLLTACGAFLIGIWCWPRRQPPRTSTRGLVNA